MTIKDLQTELDKLKARSRNWLIAFGVALILAIVLLFTVFGKQPATDQSYKLEIKTLQDKIDLMEQSNNLRDSIISQHDQKLSENRKTETIVKHHYDQIPVNTPTDKSGIRGEFADY